MFFEILLQSFAFSPGQVLFDGKDIGVKTGLAQDVLKKLVEHFGLVVKFKELDESVETTGVRLRATNR